MRRTGILCVLASAGAILAPAAATGADLTLVCPSQATDAGGSQHDLNRKIEIIFGNRIVRFYDKIDGKYRLVENYSFVSAEKNMITFRNDDDALENIDRVSGKYYFRDKRSGTAIQGTCMKTEEKGDRRF